MVYKWCVVPQCTNTTIKSPDKSFVSVPTNPKRREMWLQLARRDPKSILSHTNVFMCEDHFEMETDTINYMQYKMGYSQKILLADEAVPSKFDCQEDRKRRRKVFAKRQRADLIKECQSATETNAESLQKDDNMIQNIIEPEEIPKTQDKETITDAIITAHKSVQVKSKGLKMPPPIRKELKINLEDTNAVIKHILNTITERCNFEAENDFLTIPLNNIEERIQYYTGLSKNNVAKLLYDTSVRSQLTLESRILILKTIKELYIKCQLPTYNNIYEEIRNKLETNNDEQIGDITEFMKEMETLGYVMKETINNLTIVIEHPEIRFERFMYLHKLKKFRSNSAEWQQVVYVDERLVNLTQNYAKPLKLETLLTLSIDMEESVFYHAVSNTGLIAGTFTNKDKFDKWVTEVLLVQLKCPSVIIMDTLQGPPKNVRSITRYHSKAMMLRWLTDNCIPCSSDMSKPALYELIAKCNESQKEYDIDHIFRSQGHEVLRLPRHFSELSITTPLWNDLQKRQRNNKENTLINLQNALVKTITDMPEATWTAYEQEIENTEKELLKIETSIEKYSDVYQIKI